MLQLIAPLLKDVYFCFGLQSFFLHFLLGGAGGRLGSLGLLGGRLLRRLLGRLLGALLGRRLLALGGLLGDGLLDCLLLEGTAYKN